MDYFLVNKLVILINPTMEFYLEMRKERRNQLTKKVDPICYLMSSAAFPDSLVKSLCFEDARAHLQQELP